MVYAERCEAASKTETVSVRDFGTYTVGMIMLADKDLTAKETYTEIDLPNGSTYADESFNRESYWSSSQVQNFRGTEAWAVFLRTGNVSETAKFIDILTCAIADF